MKIIINVPPRTKKNHSQIIYVKGRPLIIPSKQYREYEESVKPFLEGLVKEPIGYPVNIKCIYYMPTKRACDLNNLLEATTDVLVKYKVVEDDNYKIVQSHDGSRVFVDKDNPRTEIEIEEVHWEED